MKKVYLLCVVLMIFSCQTGKEQKINTEGKKVFRYNESAGISFLDPAYATRFEDVWAMSQLYNGLVQFDEQLNVIPCIAKRWEINTEQTEYTFYLRNDVYFHDHEIFESGKGRKVVAQDFVNSFFRITDPEIASPGSYIFQNVDYSTRSKNKGFVAVNDTTLKIYLKQAQHQFLEQLSLPFCYVIPIEIADYYGNDFSTHPVGTGPFKFKTWKKDVKLVMVKNENYFEKDASENSLPYIDAVSISFIRDKHMEYKEFLKGKFEFISGLDDSYRDMLLNNNGTLKNNFKEQIRLLRTPWLKTDYLGILVDNEKEIVQNSPLKNKLIRKAINYSINRRELVNLLRNGIGEPAEFGFVPVGMPGFKLTRVNGFTYNPEKAKTLIFESGLKKEELPEVTLVTTTEYKNICEYLKQNIDETGLKCKIEVVVPSVQKQMVSSYTANFFRKSWTADYPDAINFLQLFYSKNFSPNGPNYTHYKNSLYDAYFEEALTENNEEKRLLLYHKMEEILLDDAPVVPLFYDEAIKFVQNYVDGLEVNAMNQLNLKKVRIVK